ncbi:MAG: hypothetical protein AAF486_05230, partial [Pseudomonadota bacterium]
QTFSSNCGVFQHSGITSMDGSPCGENTNLPWIAEYIFGEYIAEVEFDAFFDAGFAYASYYASDVVPDSSSRAGAAMVAMGEGGLAPTSTLMAWAAAYGAAIDALADEDWLLFSFHLLSLNKYLPHDVRRQDDPVSITESMIAGLIEAGEIPPGDPAILSGMALGVMMQSGQNKAYNRFDTPMADHIDTFTRAIVAILKQR